MKTTLISRALAALLVAAFLATSHAALTYKGPELATLPAPVQKTIKARLGDGKILSIEESIEDEESYYTVEMKKDGMERSFSVSEEGTVSSIQYLLEETPEIVRKAIVGQLSGAKLIEIDLELEEDPVTYDVEMTKNSRDRWVSITTNGILSSAEVFWDELPLAVQKAIETRLGSGRLGEIYLNIEDGVTTYEVAMTRHTKSRPFSVLPDGKLVSAEVGLEETPAEVKGEITTRVGDGYIDKIELFLNDGPTRYEVTFTKADASKTFTVKLGETAPASVGKKVIRRGKKK